MKVLLSFILFFTGILSSLAQYDTFANKDGKSIRAFILSKTADSVLIETPDGKQYSLQNEVFDESTQNTIKQWRDPKFKISVVKSRLFERIRHDEFVTRRILRYSISISPEAGIFSNPILVSPAKKDNLVNQLSQALKIIDKITLSGKASAITELEIMNVSGPIETRWTLFSEYEGFSPAKWLGLRFPDFAEIDTRSNYGPVQNQLRVSQIPLFISFLKKLDAEKEIVEFEKLANLGTK